MLNTSVLDFTGQSAIVTGGATGIGESCARLLARRGALLEGGVKVRQVPEENCDTWFIDI